MIFVNVKHHRYYQKKKIALTTGYKIKKPDNFLIIGLF